MSSVVGIPRHVGVALATGVVSLLCAGLFVIVSLHESDEALHRVKRSRDVHAVVESLRRHLLHAEAAHRSYLLLEKPASLDAYRRAHHDVEQDLFNLRRIQRDLPGGPSVAADLDARVRSLEAFRQQVIAAYGSDGRDASRALLSTDAAHASRDAVDRALSAVERRERALSTARVEREHEASQRAVDAVLTALLIALLFGLWAVRALRYESALVAHSERRYRTLAQANPDAVFVIVTGRFVYANSAATQLFAATREQPLLGRTLVSFVVPGERALTERLLRTRSDQDSPDVAQLLGVTRVDGVTIELEVQCASIEFEGCPATQIVARDVTSRREAELNLLLREQRLRAVIDGMAEGLVLEDESGKVQLWNAAAERLLGLNAEQLNGKCEPGPGFRVSDASGAELEGYRHHMRRAVTDKAPSTGKIVVARPGHEPTWLRVSAIPLCHPGDARPYAVVGTYADVTATELATRKLQESEARYRLLADNTADLVSRRDVSDRFEYASPSHTAVLGWTPEELVGRVGYELVHPDDQDRVRVAEESARQDMQEASAPVPVAARFQHKDGHYVWLELVFSPLRNSMGEVSGRLVSARDISVRRQLEEQLYRSKKMESMGRMAGAVAHDFNNLLTVIRTSVELIRGAMPDGGDEELALHEIVHAVERASALTTQLLAFCRGQHASPSALAIAPLLRTICGLLRRLTAVNCALEVTIDPVAESAWVRAERVSIEQVLFNLVSNANDAMPNGGAIRLACGVARLEQDLNHRFGTIRADSYVTLSVEDTGTGIDDNVLTNIFEPFFTTKPQGKGTGLGLSTVYGIVQQARGSVAVETTPGGGARFTVYWPLVTDPARASLSRVATAASPVAACASYHVASTPAAPLILLVEDEASVRRLVSRLLERFGYRVLVADSGVEGLALLSGSAHAIRALICDVRMPGMGGVELFQKLKGLGKALPVLFISGQLDASLPAVGYAGQAPRLLTKPFRSQDLEREVQALLAESAMSA